MNDVFLLGAGFSKAINKLMPTMAELARELREALRETEHALPRELERYQDDIEMWMSYLSQVQPWLSGPEIDLHRSLAGRIRQLIGQIVDERAWRISGSAPPEWFSRLVLCWHKRQAVIITLNYDTLIESAARAGVPEEPRTGETLQDNKRQILPGQIYPSYFTNVAARGGAGLWGEESLKTFRLLKLHGSVNWYYSGREAFFGETIFYNDIPEFEIPEDGNARSKKLEQLMGLVGDKEMLIIPPVTEKTTYFNNETIRALWNEAGKALRVASKYTL